MYLVICGVNHKTAPIDIRERFSIAKDRISDALLFLKDVTNARECLILSTCNRTLICLVYPSIPAKENSPYIFFERYFYPVVSNLDNYLFFLENEEAVRHIFRIASGLESLIIGEPQILGQVKEFYFKSFETGTTSIILNQLFRKAIETGKKVRTDTKIGKNMVSIPYAAIEYAKKISGSICEKNIMIIGSGKISELTLKNLNTMRAANLFVVNRTFERSQAIALKFNATPMKYDTELNFLISADIVISSTSAMHYVIKEEPLRKIMKKRKGRELLLFDIALPRDVEPKVKDIADIKLFNIDDLNSIVEEKLQIKKREIANAERIIEIEICKFNNWLSTLDIIPVISAFRSFLDDTMNKEFNRIFKKGDKIPLQIKDKIEYFGKALVNKIAHTPTKKMKQNSQLEKGLFYSQIISELFDLETKNKK